MANLSNINNKFIVTDGGNVLIGDTANSSGRLQIKDTQTSSFNDGLAITRNNAAQTGYINMVGGAFNFNSPGLSYKFRNNGTQTLELNSSGNVLINSGVYLSWGTNGASSIEGSTVSNKLQFRTNSADAMIIDSSQNVGIGVASLQSWARLQVAGTAGAQTGAKQALYVTSPSTTAGEGVGIRMSAASGSNEAVGIIGMVNNASGNAGSMTFHTYNGGADIPERMRITSDGDVFIGNSSVTTANTAIFLNKSGIITNVLANSGGTTDLMQFYQQNGGGIGTISRNANGICMNGNGQTNQLVVADSGNVGIGTTAIPINGYTAVKWWMEHF